MGVEPASPPAGRRLHAAGTAAHVGRHARARAAAAVGTTDCYKYVLLI